MSLASPRARAPRPVAPRYLFSCGLSLLGNSVAGVALPLVLLATTGDALAAGTLALICAAPQFLIGLVGGALIDRFNRRDVSVISDILSAASVALLPVVDAVWGLSFGWFVALGLVGAVGDIPGMTARDALVPAVCERDGRSLQKFMGLTQSLDSLVVIVGPALAAFLMGSVGAVNALWFTAVMSLAAALTTLTLPRAIGRIGGKDVPAGNEGASAVGPGERGIVSGAWNALHSGARVLFAGDALLRSSMFISFGIVMIMGSFQGLVLPVHFTAAGTPELLGYVLSAMSAGMLASSLGYAALASKLRRRTWFVLSLAGMALGILGLGLLPSFPLLAFSALLLGLAAGPLSALLGFFIFDRIPAEMRGSALGTQNSLTLAAAPVAVFATSLAVEAWGAGAAAIGLAACWFAATLWALSSRSLSSLDDESEEAIADPTHAPAPPTSSASAVAAAATSAHAPGPRSFAQTAPEMPRPCNTELS
ncbi:MFS transporter [Adlercreutzia sp. R25]|uniref:MFS transporter n=1 Tax=Adlercreutzia shanghongiae TaxID=3111773 RepID=UPI002DBDB941|nr:MFS transporter [Adlercreutzia sp. R25]MEC4272868.1 MFS transporter [Adlercreutzia sp. R25]